MTASTDLAPMRCEALCRIGRSGEVLVDDISVDSANSRGLCQRSPSEQPATRWRGSIRAVSLVFLFL